MGAKTAFAIFAGPLASILLVASDALTAVHKTAFEQLLESGRSDEQTGAAKAAFRRVSSKRGDGSVAIRRKVRP